MVRSWSAAAPGKARAVESRPPLYPEGSLDAVGSFRKDRPQQAARFRQAASLRRGTVGNQARRVADAVARGRARMRCGDERGHGDQRELDGALALSDRA